MRTECRWWRAGEGKRKSSGVKPLLHKETCSNQRMASTKPRVHILVVRGARAGGMFGGDFLCSDYGVGVDLDGVFDAAGVAAGESGGHGNVAGASELEDAFVASLQASFGEAEAAELVFAKWVGATDVKQNIGTKFIERSFNGG